MTSKAILLVQTIEDPSQVDFDYSLEKWLKKKNTELFLSCDSQSDQVMIHYINKMFESTDAILMIFDCRLSENIGIGHKLLSMCIRRAGVELVCLGNSAQLKPFMQLMKGISFDTEAELLSYLSSKVSASL